jgi:hypothetical protein
LTRQLDKFTNGKKLVYSFSLMNRVKLACADGLCPHQSRFACSLRPRSRQVILPLSAARRAHQGPHCSARFSSLCSFPRGCSHRGRDKTQSLFRVLCHCGVDFCHSGLIPITRQVCEEVREVASGVNVRNGFQYMWNGEKLLYILLTTLECFAGGFYLFVSAPLSLIFRSFIPYLFLLHYSLAYHTQASACRIDSVCLLHLFTTFTTIRFPRIEQIRYSMVRLFFLPRQRQCGA